MGTHKVFMQYAGDMDPSMAAALFKQCTMGFAMVADDGPVGETTIGLALSIGQRRKDGEEWNLAADPRSVTVILDPMGIEWMVERLIAALRLYQTPEAIRSLLADREHWAPAAMPIEAEGDLSWEPRIIVVPGPGQTGEGDDEGGE